MKTGNQVEEFYFICERGIFDPVSGNNPGLSKKPRVGRIFDNPTCL
jgi:hypothetical protein